MCIIAIYPKGIRPDKKTLDIMINGNPDGVGVAWNDGKMVEFVKGLTTSEEVLELYDKHPEARDFVFHSRIATSGGVSAEKCHPFIVAESNALLNKTSGRGVFPVAFHNGVFNIKVDKGLNDTQTFIKYCLAPLRRRERKGLHRGKYNGLLTMATSGSRFVLLYPDRIYTFGNWQEADGVKYSNGNFRPYTRVYTRYSWDDYDGGWYGGRAYSQAVKKDPAPISSYIPAKYRLADALRGGDGDGEQ